MLILGGCGGDGDGDGGSGGGATLEIGEAATVGYFPLANTAATEPTGELTVTVLDVRKGSQAEMKQGGFKLDPEERATTPYYVDVRYKNTGAVTVKDLRAVSGEAADGTSISALTVISLGGPPFKLCPPLEQERLAPGESAKDCTILLVPEGSDLERISYFPGGVEDFVYWDAA